MHYIFEECSTPYKNKISEYSIFCRVEKKGGGIEGFVSDLKLKSQL